jgi:hypothetical protein
VKGFLLHEIAGRIENLGRPPAVINDLSPTVFFGEFGQVLHHINPFS